MVIEGSPDPPEVLQEELTPPLCSVIDFRQQVVDSDDDVQENNYDGYAPLPLGPTDDNELIPWNGSLDSSDEEEGEEPQPMDLAEESSDEIANEYVPPIETVDREISRELWTRTRNFANIEMNSDKAQEVMSAMANFSLPTSSFPEWAHSISEDEWKQQLADRITVIQENR